MNWFRVRLFDNCNPDLFVTDVHDFGDIPEEDLRKGMPLNQWGADFYLKCTDVAMNGTPDDALQNHLGLPIFSAKLCRHLGNQDLLRDVQLLPVKVQRPDGEEISGYSVVNILRIVPALDRERSDFDVFDKRYFIPERRGAISGVRRAVLMKNALAGLQLIRLAEFEVMIFAEATIERVFAQGEFTGAAFDRVDLS